MKEAYARVRAPRTLAHRPVQGNPVGGGLLNPPRAGGTLIAQSRAALAPTTWTSGSVGYLDRGAGKKSKARSLSVTSLRA